MEIEIQKLVYPGKSFSTYNGKVLFTDEGLPGETVEIKTVKEKNTYIEAITLNILNASNKRVEPLCPHYKTCSPYQYMDYSYQLLIKETQIKEIFAHNLKIELKDFKIKQSRKIWGYRNKLRLHLLWKNDTAYLAYHSLQAHNEFVPISECHLASENMNKALAFLVETINKHKLKFIEEVEIKENTLAKILIVFFGKSSFNYKNFDKHFDEMGKKFSLEGITYISKDRLQETLLYGKNYIEEKIGDKTFQIGGQSFFQINIDALKLLILDMTEAIKLRGFKAVADLYCGIGTFGIIFADKAEKVLGGEILEENIFFLKENIKINHINNYSLYKGASENIIDRILKEKIDTLIIDPPRKGIGKEMCERLAENGPKHIFYVSCDPITLARDLKTLLQKYELTAIHGYDFFPHTPHIETFSILDRK
ncbi:MAG: class I SAM-dependent RNA methyltransferase [Candidatus Omnitrophica bacterium]|jgi:23S rRNA (uracil1939-C5)-methyltransferase|nr:class I SAM-dependent RNA methyltransferase [Candidatus Omnitrophota bacterium]